MENFFLGTSPVIRRANFELVYPVTLNVFVDGFNSKINFHDPWYVSSANSSQPLSSPNTFIEFQSPLNPTGAYNETTGGVFLGVDYTQHPYYEVEALNSIDNKPIYTLTNWTTTQGLADFESPNSYRTKVQFIQPNTVIEKRHKGQLMSNYSNNYTNSGQRKIVRTSDGTLHIVYQSLDKIWYERSTDGGTTWQTTMSLTSSDGKSPSVCVYGNNVILAYQENSAGNAQIRIKNYLYASGSLSEQASVTIATSVANTVLTNPTVSSTNGGLLAVVWQENKIYYKTYDITTSTITANTGSGNSGYFGTINSVTPAVVASGPGQSGFMGLFHIAYEQKFTTYSNVMYKQLQVQSGNVITQGSVTPISTGSGYTWNYLPSIIVLNDDIARLNWVGQRQNPYDPDIQDNVSIFKSADYYYFWSFGSIVTSSQINRSNAGYLIAWSQGSSIYNKDNTILNSSTIRTVNNVTGGTVQVSEGLASNTFYVAANNINLTPYRFSVGAAQYGMGKSQSGSIANGRAGVIAQDDAQFYFVLGDVTVNGEQISFNDFPDTISTLDLANLNKVLTTKSFQLNNNSQFYFSVQYGTTDSGLAVNLLGSDKSVTYSVDMIDSYSKEIIGSFDNITFDSNNPLQYNNYGYQVDVNGIGSRSVQLRLSVSQNGLDPIYNVTDRQSTEDVIIGKKSRSVEHITYRGRLTAKEYTLIQNYPNPFNPTTTITYSLPKAGHLTLKVYDLLGKEIATLVNSYKESGNYTVDFDGSKLSSGIYVYKIVSGDFTETKKMTLMK